MVDGEPARDDRGEKLTTPCEVDIPAGNRTLTVVREKFRDYSEEVVVSRGETFEFAPVFEPFAEVAGYFASRIAAAKVGKPIELANVNAGGPAWDPFLAADGLSLWFAGQKSDGRGIYVARRAQVFSDFGEAELVSRNSDRPASPSLTDNLLTLAYSVPGKAQIRSLARGDVNAHFKQGPTLRFNEEDDKSWISAEISPDGKTLYYAEDRGDKTTAYVTKRRALGRPFDGEAKSFRLPGGHPRLTRDGLRQFWFDGEQLFRSSRVDLESAFTTPEPICEFGFDGYTPRPTYRQHFVSDDEQWLYYSDDPQETGKLFVVRIASSPRWGYAPRGRNLKRQELARNSSIGESPKEKEEAKPTEPMPSEETERPAELDPRTAPLAYAEFTNRLEGLIAARDLPAAQEAIAAAQKDERLALAKTLLEWDREDVERLVRFQERVNSALSQLKPGDVVKAGSVQLEFAKYEEGEISGKVKGSDKTVSRSLAEFAPTDLVALVDKRAERSDKAAQLEIATFLDRSPKVSPQAVQTRFERAGAKGKEVAERKNLRQLRLIEQEVARNNLGAALSQISQLIDAFPKSKAADQARKLRDELPARIQWRAVGKQTWDTSVPGEHAVTGSKTPGSYLMSPIEYRNFLLTLEWKTTSDLAQGGIYFHFRGAGSKDSGDLRKNAFKIHLAGDWTTRDSPDKFATGSLFTVKAPSKNAVKLNGQWNTLSLRVEDNRVQAVVNGVAVLDTPASLPTVPAAGFVCLDGEFPGISYRKVLVYEVPPPGK
ncbi:MAG TPA: family 16 glycoside hydrolase [Planctomycetaceae bacterium]